MCQGDLGSLLWATDDADYVIGVLAIDGGKTGYLITAESIGQGLLAKLERISKGFEEYAQLKQLKKPLKVSFLLILGVLGMITIFGSVWFASACPKSSRPPFWLWRKGPRALRKATSISDSRIKALMSWGFLCSPLTIWLKISKKAG